MNPNTMTPWKRNSRIAHRELLPVGAVDALRKGAQAVPSKQALFKYPLF